MNNIFLVGSSTMNREENDFYKTPEHVTKSLLDREIFIGTIWEPACGDGAISKVLKRFNDKVFSSDIIDRGYGETFDFLTVDRVIDNVITNPPFSLAQDFVIHALNCSNSKVAMLLKLNFLESKKRKTFFESTPLKTVYVFSSRISFDRGNIPGKGNGLLAYAWYVWDKNYKSKPYIEWL